LRTVQTTGTVWMPRLGEVRVQGLTPAEIGTQLTELLARVDPARPAVTVTVVEEQTSFVKVAGAVNKPGRHPLAGGRRLLDVLLAAGGFTSEASGEVVVQRHQGTFADGAAVQRFHFPRGDVSQAVVAALETALNKGDVVTASATEYVIVSGAVARPGRYALRGETTVSMAVSSAGGLTRLGRRRVKVSRRDPATGEVRSLPADLEAIEKGREPDLTLRPDDHVEVEARPL
jgi:polysaccharide export outer membrane protein